MSYTVKQIAELAGVSARTLRYYDEIELMKPEYIGENGYRYYNDDSLLRLQQILFYRELGLTLNGIKAIVSRGDFDIQSTLESHRISLQRRVERLERLIRTVDDTILHLKGEKTMSKRQLFEAFSEEQQEKYQQEAMQMYDADTVRASVQKWKSYTAKEKQRIGEEGNAVYADIVAAMPRGPASDEAQSCIERWRRHMEYFWTPELDHLLGLAEAYNTHPDFAANFAKIHPGLAAFMREAVRIYVERCK